MPVLRLAVALALVVPSCTEPARPAETLAEDPPSPEAAGVAVVELFTSEGCSSCPPADAVLRALAARADSTGEALLPLSFHVDYWDRLGWADPYAQPAFTARQRAYAASGAFEDGRVFTPAMVVGGEGGFVGSRQATAEARVSAALMQTPPASVRLAPTVEGRTVEVSYAVAEAPTGAVLHLALVEDDTAQQVTRGENRGRRLTHARVVRAFATVPAGEGRVTLRLPDGLDVQGARVVGYVQPAEVGPVLGAAQARLGTG